jgi:hypothetical protein
MAPPRKQPRRELPREHSQLAEAAKRKAGSTAQLARMFAVTPQAASEWGRNRPIPRHVFPRLAEYVGLSVSDRSQPSNDLPELIADHRDMLEQTRALLSPDVAEIAKLPTSYQDRYRERIDEIRDRMKREIRRTLSELVANVERELTDFRARLSAEHRSHRRGSRSPAERRG